MEGLYYPCSENKGADKLHGYREADLRPFFAYAKSQFSHDEAHTVTFRPTVISILTIYPKHTHREKLPYSSIGITYCTDP